MKRVVLSPKSFHCFNNKYIDFEWYREEPEHYTTVYHVFIQENSRNLIAVVYQSGSKKTGQGLQASYGRIPICILLPHEI